MISSKEVKSLCLLGTVCHPKKKNVRINGVSASGGFNLEKKMLELSFPRDKANCPY